MSESPSSAYPSTPDQYSNISWSSNVTSAQAGSDNNSSIATSYIAASTSHDQASHLSGTVVALTLLLVAISAAVIFGFLYLKRKRKLPTTWTCWKPITRSQKTSISGSRRALAELDDMETTVRSQQPCDNTDDMFTIEDFDDNTDPQEGRQEYFYDEVFGQSQFEDETTNNAMRNLYSENSSLTQEEMLNIDNEIQGAYIHDFIPDSDNKRFA